MTHIPTAAERLPVMEIFYSIQGEGFHAGKPAVFIRLAGCEVGCHWCDVKESWDAGAHPSMALSDIVDEAGRHPCSTIVVTGGEPTSYDLEQLTQVLKQKGYQLHLETSGAYPMTGEWDWVTFSPKKFKRPHPSVYKRASELKAIIYNHSDFAFAESFVPEIESHCLRYMQAEWTRASQMTPFIIDYIKAHPAWSISLQTHKYLNIP